MNSEKAIVVLNTLIEVNDDRIECYQTASRETKDKNLRTLFSKFIETSKKFKSELVTEVHKMGGSLTNGSKTSGKFVSAWRGVKDALLTQARNAILKSCEEAEDVVREFYHSALRKNLHDINSDQHAILSEQNYMIRDDHDKLRSMREGMVLEQQ